MSALLRQHLIDPEICIRCNTCEETCPVKAVTHDRRNYVVDFDLCNSCGKCLPPCPTGAIDSWRSVLKPHPLAEQLKWDLLPQDDAASESEPSATDVPPDVAKITAQATAGQGGVAPPPWSAAHPYIGLFTPEKAAIATVVGNHRLTSEDSEVDIRHVVLDFGRAAFPVLEGQSIGIVPPGLDEFGKTHHVRLYSVASPRDGERPKHNNLSLTVKRVTVDHEGKPTVGIASSYVCDLKKGDTVKVSGPYGTSFLMPNHPGAKLMMVCTGTGSAPMRAMTERRRRRMALNEGGEILLYFGARKPEELPYFGPLQKLPAELIDVQLAFSRVPGAQREYVQDRMRAQGDKVARWLQDAETFVYLCGHKRMEVGVMEAFAEICRARGVDWASLADTLRREGRLHVETY
ncbi:MAG: benzoyl-CoA 2,3-epoxidase subunit BoxA [Polyangiales bacterium]